VGSGWRGDIPPEPPKQRWADPGACESREVWNRSGSARRGVRERRAKRVGAPISQAILAQNGAVVNRNLLLMRYPFERLAKSFKRGELQRRWGRKVTIGKTRSKTEVRGKRVRRVTRVVPAGRAGCLLGRCERDSEHAHAKPAYCGTQNLSTSLSATRQYSVFNSVFNLTCEHAPIESRYPHPGCWRLSA